MPVEREDQKVADLVNLVMLAWYAKLFYVLEAAVMADYDIKFGSKIGNYSSLSKLLAIEMFPHHLSHGEWL